MPERTKHQEKIIRNYYQNLDGILVQRLSEQVTDLYLAEGKQRNALWKRIRQTLEKLKLPATRIEHLVEADNPSLLAGLVQELTR